MKLRGADDRPRYSARSDRRLLRKLELVVRPADAVDADDRIINANDEFLRMLGYARDEFIRRKPR